MQTPAFGAYREMVAAWLEIAFQTRGKGLDMIAAAAHQILEGGRIFADPLAVTIMVDDQIHRPFA